MKDFELSLRIHDLLRLERKRAVRRKKKVKWAGYLTMPVPVIHAAGPNREWVQGLKEKVNNIEL